MKYLIEVSEGEYVATIAELKEDPKCKPIYASVYSTDDAYKFKDLAAANRNIKELGLVDTAKAVTEDGNTLIVEEEIDASSGYLIEVYDGSYVGVITKMPSGKPYHMVTESPKEAHKFADKEAAEKYLKNNVDSSIARVIGEEDVYRD